MIRYAVEKIMCEDATIWRSHRNYRSLVLRPTDSAEPPADRRTKLMAYGTLTALHLAWLGVGPDPVSPFLIQSLIGGVESIVDLHFISRLDNDLAVELRRWPLDNEVPIPTSDLDLAVFIAGLMDFTVRFPA